LLDHGHPDAGLYPFGVVWDEAELVVQRLNNQQATAAILIQAAISSVLAEEGGKQFGDLIDRLTGD
jgi:hypothetical protein